MQSVGVLLYRFITCLEPRFHLHHATVPRCPRYVSLLVLLMTVA